MCSFHLEKADGQKTIGGIKSLTQPRPMDKKIAQIVQGAPNKSGEQKRVKKKNGNRQELRIGH